MAASKVVANEVGDDSGLTVLEMVKQKDERVAAPKRKRGAAGARKVIVDAMPDMADALVEEAMKGSLPHLKLAFELGGAEKAGSKAAAKPVYSQRVERQLLQEMEAMFPDENAAEVSSRGTSSNVVAETQIFPPK